MRHFPWWAFSVLWIASCVHGPQPQPAKPVPRSTETISIASWNLQVFGQSKIKKDVEMSIIVALIKEHDVVAVQEIKDKEGTAFEFLMNRLNEAGGKYGSIVSDRVGSGGGVEQYAYIYRIDRIDVLDRGFIYSGDGADVFARPPLVSRFKAKKGNFDFVLINSHTAPERAESEIRSLHLPVAEAKKRYAGEKDVIVLGDLNADCSYFNTKATDVKLRSRDFLWLIKDGEDTNVGKSVCAYDRIVATSDVGEDYGGRIAIHRSKDPLQIWPSDHWMVSGLFYIDRDSD